MEPLTLGELTRLLGNVHNQKAKVRFDFCRFTPGTLQSYRGFYDHLAFVPEGDARKTVEEVLAECRKANGATFEGYKGGSYTMNDATPIWVSPYGEESSTAVVGVQDEEYVVVLRTAYVC